MKKIRVDYEQRFEIALRRILSYMTPEQLRRDSERRFGLEYEEALEMTYENVREEARAAVHGYRRKRVKAVDAGATKPEGSQGESATHTSSVRSPR